MHMPLWERIDQIEDYLEKCLSDPSLNLGARSILIGELSRSVDVKPPVLVVFLDDSPIENPSGIAEEWGIMIVVVAVVHGSDYRENRKKARKMAGVATAALLKDRTMGGLIRDLSRTQYSPGMARVQGGEQVYGTGYTLRAMFRQIER